jgi:biopolymer transport protein ExbB/TolQ
LYLQLQTILHTGSQAILYPVLILLIGFVLYALVKVGVLIAEWVRERRYFKTDMPAFLHELKDAGVDQMEQRVKSSGLLKSQQKLLLTIFENRDLDEESRWALAKELLLGEKDMRSRRVARNMTFSKVAPMVGLMGTLIPLGPGIVAFGQGDASTMSSAMLIAFDTTVAGLVAAAILYLVARIRRRWYAQYDSAIEAGVTSLLEKIDRMPEEQRVSVPASEGEGEVQAA